MIVRGRVHGGVVVLADGARLPEGTEVTVLASGQPLECSKTHSILDIPPVSVGSICEPCPPSDDLLGEMLEDRA